MRPRRQLGGPLPDPPPYIDLVHELRQAGEPRWKVAGAWCLQYSPLFFLAWVLFELARVVL